MATIRKTRGKWQCVVRRAGFPQQSSVFSTEAAAAAWGQAVETAMRDGTFEEKPKEPPPRTVRDLLQRYWEQIKKKNRRDKARIERLQAVFGKHLTQNLTSLRITQYKADRLSKGAGPQTVLHELVSLHHAYRVGVEEWGLVLPSGIPRTRRPKLPPGRAYRITPAIVGLIKKSTESTELGDIMDFAIETCMRRSEITGLRQTHVSLLRRTATLSHTKNGEARTVPLSPRALEILTRRVKEDEAGPVFHMSPDAVSRAFTRALERIDMRHLRFHDLRHEGISRLFEKGLNMIEVSRISGHKTLSMLNRYTHLDVGDLADKLAGSSEKMKT